MKHVQYLFIAFSLVFLIACNKSESTLSKEVTEPPVSSAQVEIQEIQAPAPTPPPLRGGAHDDIPDLSGGKVIVPDMVKGKWKRVVFMLEDKKSLAITEHTVDIGNEWAIPNSNIKVKTGIFLPDLIIQGTIFTSVSNELKNPAVHVIISENGEELFKGWLFSLFPGMHSFQHDQFAITLKDVIAS